MKVAIFGVSGQLGSDVAAALSSHDVIPVDEADVDIRNSAAVTDAVRASRPDWVINCAAMTNVEGCERDPGPAFAVNALGAGHVARAAETAGARLVHISTDYVFDGSKATPYAEDDLPRPLNVYGASKLAGEWAVRAETGNGVIVRTTGLYGYNACVGKGTNFAETMAKRAESGAATRVVNDEILTPTFSVDLAAQLRLMIERAIPPGIYHATNSGACSWFEFAREVFALRNAALAPEPISAAEWSSPVRRPRYSVLDHGALAALGHDIMPPWRDALARYLRGRSTPR
jgi:dTDP-4-dehydrorhamnose reductase